MAQLVYRANLSSAFFPFVSEYQGRTVIVPGQDNSFNRQLQSGADLDKDVGIPQLYYCHNVLPNGNGLQSIGYETRILGLGASVTMKQQFSVREDSLSRQAYMTLAEGYLYFTENESIPYPYVTNAYYDAGVLTYFPIDFSSRQLTTAHVAGVTYFYIANLGCFQYNFTLGRIDLVTLTGLDPTKIIAITESNGYLIALSTSAVAWSSTITPTDFVPSLQTGAGGGNVEGIKGNITCAATTSNGFTVFTEKNAVSVLYTGNSRYPFQFAACAGSGGVSSLERVSYEAESGYNYAYTSKGLQVIQPKSAQTVFADLTDFLAGQYFEDYNETTGLFEYQTLSSPMAKKLTLIAARYLVISYGITELTHALVYDIVQKRFGKLKFTHVDCFEYELLSAEVSDVPKKAIGFLTSDGTVKVVNFALAFTNRSGVAIFGKYQYVRSRLLQIQTISFENPTVGGQFFTSLWTSYDGKNTSAKSSGVPLATGRNVVTYAYGSPVGINHSLAVSGCFNLTTIELAFNVHGGM